MPARRCRRNTRGGAFQKSRPSNAQGCRRKHSTTDVFGIFVLARPCDLTLIELSHLISVYNWNHDTVGTYGMVPTVPWSRRYRSAVTVETDSEFSAYAPEPPQQGPVRIWLVGEMIPLAVSCICSGCHWPGRLGPAGEMKLRLEDNTCSFINREKKSRKETIYEG